MYSSSKTRFTRDSTRVASVGVLTFWLAIGIDELGALLVEDEAHFATHDVWGMLEKPFMCVRAFLGQDLECCWTVNDKTSRAFRAATQAHQETCP